MAKKKTTTPFADTAQHDGPASRDRSAERRIAALTRLVGNDDFKEWMFGILYELCAFCDDTANVDDFNQGKRAAGAFIRRTLLAAEGAPEFFASLDKRYYDGVRRGIIEATRKNTNNEGIR